MPFEADRSCVAAAARGGQHCGLLALLAFVLILPIAPLRADSTPGKRAPTPPSRGSRTAIASDAMRLLQANCLSCHDAEKQKGGLQLTSRKGVLKGGDNGPAALPGKPDQSPIVRVLAAEADPHMPPKKQLSTNQVTLIRRWVQSGLPWDAAALTNREPAIRPVTLGDWPAAFRPALAVAFSPDGHRLAAGRARELAVHDMEATNFPAIHRVVAHRDAVRCLAWSEDGRLLASGSFRELTMWDVTTLKPRWSITNGLAGRITAVRFTPDSRRLLAADVAPAQPGWVRVYDAETGNSSSAWAAHGDAVHALAISRDGKRLATAGADKLVKVWSLDDGRELTVLEGHTAGVLAVAFNSDATQLVSGGADKQLKVWDILSKETTGILGNHRHGLNAVAWSDDDKTIVAIDDAGVARSYTELKRHTGEQSSASGNERSLGDAHETLYALAITSDAGRIAAGTHSGTVYLWSAEGKLLGKLEPPATP